MLCGCPGYLGSILGSFPGRSICGRSASAVGGQLSGRQILDGLSSQRLAVCRQVHDISVLKRLLQQAAPDVFSQMLCKPAWHNKLVLQDLTLPS